MLWRPVTRGNGNILGEATAAGSGAFSGEAIRLLIQIAARHKAAGLTQTVVAQRLGKPPYYVAKYEQGERRLFLLWLKAMYF